MYYSDPGVCDRINNGTNVMFQISPSTNERSINVVSALAVIRQNDDRIRQIVSCRHALKYRTKHIDYTVAHGNCYIRS